MFGGCCCLRAVNKNAGEDEDNGDVTQIASDAPLSSQQPAQQAGKQLEAEVQSIIQKASSGSTLDHEKRLQRVERKVREELIPSHPPLLVKTTTDNHEHQDISGLQETDGGNIICIGNPGSGKSTLLNAMVGRIAFASGMSAGSGLTTRLEEAAYENTTYIDTPGLADSRRREQAADNLNKLFRNAGSYRILFVLTLEAGCLRPQDKTTVDLVMEAIQDAHIDTNTASKYGIIINKIERSVADKLNLKADAIEQVFFLSMANDFVDAAGDEILPLPEMFKSFIKNLPRIEVTSAGATLNVKWNKYDQLINDYSEEITRHLKEQETLRNLIMERDAMAKSGLRNVEEGSEQEPDSEVEQSQTAQAEQSLFKEGDKVVALAHGKFTDKSGTTVELESGEQGTVKAVDGKLFEVVFPRTEARANLRYRDLRDRCCLQTACEDKARETVRRLAHRGIALRDLLEFYGKLPKVMSTWDPRNSTTFDVVRDAIIPETRKVMVSFAEKVNSGSPKLAMRMVTHNWGNKFTHFIAAVVADALDEGTYCAVTERLDNPKRMDDLKRKLEVMGMMDMTYWICAFCVNQHRSICKQEVYGCPCEARLILNGSPLCELDKFDKMMRFIFNKDMDANAKHVVAVDAKGVIFTRAWVLAELVTAICMDAELSKDKVELNQDYKLMDINSLKVIHKEHNSYINIDKCEASRSEDKKFVLETAYKQIEDSNDTKEHFHEKFNLRVFGSLKLAATAPSLPRILVIGNKGVGKSYLIEAMREAHRDRNFLEMPGLADETSKRTTAETINDALQNNKCIVVFFVVTLEAGRVRPEDKETIHSVLNAVRVLRDEYSIIINKVSEKARKHYEDPKFLLTVKKELISESENKELPQQCFLVGQTFDEKTVVLPPGILKDAPIARINHKNLGTVNGETKMENIYALRKKLEQKEAETKRLEDELRGTDEKIVRVCMKNGKEISVKVVADDYCNVIREKAEEHVDVPADMILKLMQKGQVLLDLLLVDKLDAGEPVYAMVARNTGVDLYIQAAGTFECYQDVLRASTASTDDPNLLNIGPMPSILRVLEDTMEQAVDVPGLSAGKREGYLEYAESEGALLVPSLDSAALLTMHQATSFSQLVITVGVNSDSYNRGLGIGVEPSAVIDQTISSEGLPWYTYNGGTQDDRKHFQLIKFHPDMNSGALRIEGFGGFSNTDIGFTPKGWSNSGKKLHTLIITLGADGLNMLRFVGTEHKQEWRQEWKHQLFDGRHLPSVHAWIDLGGEENKPLHVGPITMKATIASP